MYIAIDAYRLIKYKTVEDLYLDDPCIMYYIPCICILYKNYLSLPISTEPASSTSPDHL